MEGPWESELAKRVVIANIPLSCTHCGHDRFLTQYPDLEAWQHATYDRRTDVYACNRCGCVHSFLAGASEENPLADEALIATCLTCGAELPSDADACPSCETPFEELERKPPRPRRPGDESCLRCRGPMAPDEDVCSSCGWSFKGEPPPPVVPPAPPPEYVDLESEPEAPEPPAETAFACPHCGADRDEGASICHACGQIMDP